MSTGSNNGKPPKPQRLGKKEVYLVASGDLRLSANQKCWPAQKEMEEALTRAVEAEGYAVVRAHHYCEQKQHGFLASQSEGMHVFAGLDPKAPVIVAEAVWQYSHHLLHGLISHRGPILTVANWSGTWPGLVGMLNLNGSLTKAGVNYSTLWSEDFTDDYLPRAAARLAQNGQVLAQDAARRPAQESESPPPSTASSAKTLAEQLQRDKAIMGVFDEGCMGMFNAIIPDELLNPTGVFKERLSQSALYYESTQVSDDEANAVRNWMEDRGMKFHTGPKHDDGSHRRPDPPAVQDVHRRRAHRRRFRLRRDRHPVPAGA